MPYFLHENLFHDFITLSAEESKHIIKSMRLKEGVNICITDGKGTLVKAIISDIVKNNCNIEIIERYFYNKSTQKQLHLAVSPTKNPDRMEWLIEKAVEIGVSEISFIICDRSERKKMDLNRLHRIAIAALKQSKGVWLPEIKIIDFLQFVNEYNEIFADKFIAYCEEKTQAINLSQIEYLHNNSCFLIGPEGDFTPHEVHFAKEKGFQQIFLGEKTLRTETAALFIICCFAQANQIIF